MKRNFVYVLAALLLSGVAFTACSSEDEVVNVAAGVQTYRVSIPAVKGIDADTRALVLDGKTLNSTWTKGDKVYVYKKGTNTMDANTLEADASGTTANLTGELSGEYEEGEELLLVYGYKKLWSGATDIFPYFVYESTQKGTFDDLQNFDYATATVKVGPVKDGQITTTPASFKPSQSIYKLNFKDDSSSLKDVNVKYLTITSSGEKLIAHNAPYENTATKGDVTLTIAKPSAEVWVALRLDESIAEDVITFKVEDPDGNIYESTKAVTADVVNGKFYAATITLTKTGENTLLITPADNYIYNESHKTYYLIGDAKITGEGNGRSIGFDVKGTYAVELDNVKLTEGGGFGLAVADATFTLVGENSFDHLGYSETTQAVKFKGSGSLTFKWTSTVFAIEDLTNVTYEDGLKLFKNSDGTYTIKKGE